MTKTQDIRTDREIAIDFYRAEYGVQDVAGWVDELSVEELASIVTAAADQPHLAPATVA